MSEASKRLLKLNTLATRMTRRVSPESQAALAAGDKAVLRERVLRFVRQRGLQGATADELAAGLQLVANCVAPRLTELRQRGQVVALTDAAGKPVRRRTRQGCLAGVFVILEVGKTSCELDTGAGLNQCDDASSLFGDLARESGYPD